MVTGGSHAVPGDERGAVRAIKEAGIIHEETVDRRRLKSRSSFARRS